MGSAWDMNNDGLDDLMPNNSREARFDLNLLGLINLLCVCYFLLKGCLYMVILESIILA